MEELTKEERNAIIKGVKRLNERMRDIERKGLTDTVSYQKLQEFVANMPNAKDKTGRYRAKQTYKLTEEQINYVKKLANRTTYTAGSEMKRAAKHLDKTLGRTPERHEVIEQANAYGRVEEFIRSKLDKLYDLAVQEDRPLKDTEKEKFIEIMKTEKQFEEQKQQRFIEWYNSTWETVKGSY